MKTILHKADTRGHANHGWLDSHHTFSFANYYNPERVHFGVLRVLNDDIVEGGRGFGTHPHDNMEIISIPLEGALEHKDSMGNTFVIKKNDVQIMSAGTGVFHSEYNKSEESNVNFLQIWVFPKEKNIKPRYDQITVDPELRVNKWQTVVAPDKEGAVWINQDAYFSLGKIEAGNSLDYQIQKEGNGVYIFVLDGSIEVNGNALDTRDGLGIWDAESFNVKASKNVEVLLMDVPMTV
ncbi:pirin family protein [Chondrinema litorale]|uniref:pirin family protein n=1 Tax=Chondrinema litorale TaxID=2994555 RepID=UPI002542BFCD|nr:pirin family protein [Chondrinema litorale]UZR98727.1 pirin family protein [Chondrinema litorale]